MSEGVQSWPEAVKRSSSRRTRAGLSVPGAYDLWLGSQPRLSFSSTFGQCHPIYWKCWGATRIPSLQTNNQIALGEALILREPSSPHQPPPVDMSTSLGYIKGSKHVCTYSEEGNIHGN